MYLQLAENGEVCIAEVLSDNCGLPPLKPLRKRSNPKAADEWAKYDQKKAEWDACREGKGKPTSIHPVNAVVLAPGRSVFLAMLDFNIDGIASRLATENISALNAQWGKLGGDPNKLVKFINEGKGKNPVRMGFLPKFTGAMALAEDAPTDDNPAGLSSDQKAKIIAASTAFGVALGAAIPATAPVAIPGGPILGRVLVGVIPFIKNAANKTPSAEDAGKNIPDLPLPPSTDPQGTLTPGVPNSWMSQKNFTGLTNGRTIEVGVNVVAFGGAAVLYKRGRKKAAIAVASTMLLLDVGYYLYNKYA